MADLAADAVVLGYPVTSSAPAAVAWLTIGFSLLVVILRLVWADEPGLPEERLVTYGLWFGAGAGLLREGAVQQALSDAGILEVGTTRQVGTAFIVLTFAPLVLLALSWTDSWPERAARTSRALWTAVYVSVAVMLVAGTHARALGQYIDRTRGWETVLYFAIFSAWCGATGIVVTCTSIRDLRAGELRPSHRVTHALILIVGVWATEEAFSILVSAVCAATGTGQWFVDFRFAANQSNFIYLLLLGAIPASAQVMMDLARRLRVDSASRAVRVLTPLWSDLVRACAGEIPRPAQQDSAPSPERRLHRMTVEIRDCLLVLGRYSEPPPQQLPAALAEAVQIAEALHRKRSGAAPGGYVRLHASAPGRDIVDERRTLRSIAAHWDAAAAYRDHAAQLNGAR
ncbi:MAB_1171c family putative transporter [Nocardia sp. NPDC058058]|uniref:MAB_1171c family putative transporter n=1 Tax=Nocardia sp. NPDC058058 TaxID=3346317 RepID=UPI0036DC00A4